MHVLHQKHFCQFGRKNCDCFIAFGMTAARKQQPSCFAPARREGNEGLHSDKNVHSTLRHGYIIRGPARLSFFLLLGQTSPVKYV